MEMKKGYDDIYELLGEFNSRFSFVRTYGRTASKWLYSEEDQRTFEENVEAIEGIFKKIERICLDYLVWK
ncbi:MAG: hypothetical protein QXT86_10770 [Archaeoglobaceae archaeon]